MPMQRHHLRRHRAWIAERYPATGSQYILHARRFGP